MPHPSHCRNPHCSYASHPPPRWYSRFGIYRTIAHGLVQRYRCRRCHTTISDQTESMHYFAKRRLDLAGILSRIRGGSSQRDIARELGCSRTAVANAVLRLGRQAIASHACLLTALGPRTSVVFDGLVSAVASRDYPSQITTLVDASTELVLAMTHHVGERGGRRTPNQQRRIEARRELWRPEAGALRESIALLVHELPRIASGANVTVCTDEHPLYRSVLQSDLAIRWLTAYRALRHVRVSSRAPRTTGNPLFAVNYVDRMIRHRMREHTRESIALARNATMQMLRMWIFAWDHNVRQPARVKQPEAGSRAIVAGIDKKLIARLARGFSSRRCDLRGTRVPESLRTVWQAQLASPPIRCKAPQASRGPTVTQYALRDLAFADQHGQ